MIFQIFFDQKTDVKKNRTPISQSYRGVLSGNIQGLQIWSPTKTAQTWKEKPNRT